MLVQRRCLPLLFVGMLFATFASVSASENSSVSKVALSSMETHVETMMHAALAHDLEALQKIDKKIEKDIAQLHEGLQGQAFNERRSRELLMAYSWARVISIDIGQQAWVGVAIAANQLSASIFRFTNYPSLQQRDTAWMGYLSRELLLLNMEDPKLNAELLNTRSTDLNSTWQRVSGEIIKDFRNKPRVIEGNHLMLELGAAHKPSQVISLAKKMLVFVNKIKNLQ
ncbi:MAG: hypothetical protein COB41_06010 [Proteobacteria bacterium]|nr:MAG: hypothetical protein COB41_06010 [Pseudomonadota bacterium]